VRLAAAALINVPTIFGAAASAVVLFKFKLNSTWLIVAGALVGTAAQAFP
jgi:chromate transporter